MSQSQTLPTDATIIGVAGATTIYEAPAGSGSSSGIALYAVAGTNVTTLATYANATSVSVVHIVGARLVYEVYLGSGSTATTKLYGTDGTVAGTQLLESGGNSAGFTAVAATNSALFVETFTYSAVYQTMGLALYATDGTSAGSHVELNAPATPGDSESTTDFVSNGFAIAFELMGTPTAGAATTSIYESNGGAAGAQKLTTLTPSQGTAFPTPYLTVGAVGAQSVDNSASLSGVGVLDDDASTSDLNVVVSAVGGDVNAYTGVNSGSPAATISGAGTNDMTITGTIAEVNAALSTLAFFGTSAGVGKISLTASDNGGRASTASSAFNIATANIAAFNLWGQIGNLFVTNGQSIDGVDWGRGNLVGGSFPIWVDNSVSANASAATGYTYTIAISSQDWVQTVQSEAVVTQVTFPNPLPFSTLVGDMIFSSAGATGVGALVYWAPNAIPNGGFDLEFQSLNTTYPTAPTAGPSTTTAGSPTAIMSGIHGLRGWTFNYTASDFVYAYITAGDYTNSENIYFQAFQSDGTAEGPAEEVAANFSTASNFYVGYSAGSGYAFEYGQLAGANSGWYEESFDPTTGALGAAEEILTLPNYTAIYGMASRTLSDGSATRFVEGEVGGAHVLQVFKTSANGASTLMQTIKLTSAAGDHWSDCGIRDPLNGQNDFTALVINDSNTVSLRLYDADGAQIGAPVVIPNLTSFDKLCQLGSDRSRIEISYTYTNPAGGQSIGAYVYDTLTTSYNYTLSTSNGESIGSVFADTFTDNTGIHYIDGGGGGDTFIVPASLAAGGVDLTTNSSGQIVVNAGSGNAATLARFSTIDIGAQIVTLGGTVAAPTLKLASAGDLTLGGAIASNYTIAIPSASQIEVQVGESLGARLAKWQSGDSIVFDALSYSSADKLRFVTGAGGVGGALELLTSPSAAPTILFDVTTGSLSAANFSLVPSGSGSAIKFV